MESQYSHCTKTLIALWCNFNKLSLIASMYSIWPRQIFFQCKFCNKMQNTYFVLSQLYFKLCNQSHSLYLLAKCLYTPLRTVMFLCTELASFCLPTHFYIFWSFILFGKACGFSLTKNTISSLLNIVYSSFLHFAYVLFCAAKPYYRCKGLHVAFLLHKVQLIFSSIAIIFFYCLFYFYIFVVI